MNSVDRIHEYSSLTSENYLENLHVNTTKYDGPTRVLNRVKHGVETAKDAVNNVFGHKQAHSHTVKEHTSPRKDIELSDHTWSKHGFAHSANPLSLELRDETWPSEGRVEFRHICLQYKTSSAPVLRYFHLTFIFNVFI
jgi:hypothetical protein